MSLKRALQQLRPQLARRAQAVYDVWGTDDGDVDVGEGGICDLIADAMSEEITEALPDVDVRSGGHDGDDHAWLIVQYQGVAVGVDIPPSVYESGGGFRWKKREGVSIEPGDVLIFPAVFEDDDDL